MTIPAGFPECIVVVDISWWINRALRMNGGGVGKIVPMCTGWLATLLTQPTPTAVAVALDATGPTWRHRLFPDYKKDRPEKPPGFSGAVATVLEIVAAHSIPVLWADGYEADDAMAWAVAQANARSWPLVMLTADKDLGCLTSDTVAIWDGGDRVRRGADMAEEWGVPTSQLADLLAIMGDTSDGIPGVPGLGKEKASTILKAHGSLAAALAAPVDVAAAEARLAELKRQRKYATKRHSAVAGELDSEIARAAAQHAVAKYTKTLHEHRDAAEIARRLVALDPGGPFYWDWNMLPVGGVDARTLHAIYTGLDFHRRAAQVLEFTKRKVPLREWP